MGPIWGRQDPSGPYVGPMNFVIWVQLDFIAEDTEDLDSYNTSSAGLTYPNPPSRGLSH